MKKSLLTLCILSLPVLGLEADITATAAAAAPAPAPTLAAPKPVEKPLYVDYQPPDWAKGWEHISLKQAGKYHKDPKYLFCDARAKVEFDHGHIPGAIPMPAGEADKYYAMYEGEIKKARKLITYCHGIGCRLSEKTAQFLAGKGHKNVAVFFGGWPQWTEAALPVESGESTVAQSGPAPTATPMAPVSVPVATAPAGAVAAPAAASPAAK